jgi:MinD superfamily P-loop ATPase
VLIVAEPTVSGRHDMERVVELAAFFKIPAMLCVNKFDLNTDMTEVIEAFAKKNNITVMGRVPFDPAFTRAMVQGETIVEFDSQSKGCEAVKGIWEKLAQNLEI